MNIAVSARGLSMPVGGVKTYLEMILPRLPSLDSRNNYAIYHNSPAHCDAFRPANDVLVRGGNAFFWENFRLPGKLMSAPPDILFCPKNLLPWFIPPQVKTVITVHDLLYFPLHGRYLNEYKPHDVAYMRMFLPRSIRRADAIVTVSQHTKNDLLELFDVGAEKVFPIHHGVGLPSVLNVSASRQAEVRRVYGLDKPYMFYAGSLSPRKNVDTALRAFARIANKVPHDFVVTAGKSWKEASFQSALRATGLSARVRRLGNVDSDQLQALYAGADVFVYISLYEGFGMPVLEAMACGCPVLASSASSVPEAAGNAALLVDPLNECEIADGMFRCLTDEGLRTQLRKRGLEHAQSCSWERSVMQLVDVFRHVLEKGGG